MDKIEQLDKKLNTLIGIASTKDQKYFRRKQAADHLQINERTLDRRIKDGSLKAIKRGGVVYIPKKSIEAYLSE